MFKRLKQRIGPELIATSGQSPVTRGQVGHEDLVCHFFLVKCDHPTLATLRMRC